MMTATPLEDIVKDKSSEVETIPLINKSSNDETKIPPSQRQNLEISSNNTSINATSTKRICGFPLSSIIYAIIFFCSMVVMELALEGAGNAFPNLDGLAYGVTLSQFGFCFFLPVIVSQGAALRNLPRSPKACLPYVTLSLVVFASTCFATMSLKYCSYPTKVVFKSAKLIPTMIVATFMNRGNRYGTLDYLAAGLLCMGAAGYSYNSGRDTSGSGGETSTASLGIVLLLISVFADAFTPNLQQRLMTPPPPPVDIALPSTVMASAPVNTLSTILFPGGLGLSASELMVNVNAVGFTGLIIFMAITGTLSSVFNASQKHPMLLAYLSIVGAGLGTAVLAYTKLIRESGSVVAVAVATLRKVVTVVLSYVVYPKPMSVIHLLSGVCVFLGIVLSSYSKQRGRM